MSRIYLNDPKCLEELAISPIPNAQGWFVEKKPFWSLGHDSCQGQTVEVAQNTKGHLLSRWQRELKPLDRVVDITAGLLGDSFALFSPGTDHRVYEANPIIAFYLQLTISTRKLPLILEPTFFRPEQFHAEGDHRVYMIYDPFFDFKDQRALPKKAMQILHLANECFPLNFEELKLESLMAVCDNLAVKRTPKAPYLQQVKPNFSLESKLVRWDFYKGRKKGRLHENN
jgi:hypothetical protein